MTDTDNEQKKHKLLQKLINRPRNVHVRLTYVYMYLILHNVIAALAATAVIQCSYQNCRLHGFDGRYDSDCL